MNTEIINFLRNVSNENIIDAKKDINTALAYKVSEAIGKRETEIKDSLYNGENKEE
jgi:hypothetical protein